MDELFEKTAQLYQIKINKPKVTAKLLQKPPFRFLHDVVMALMALTGFPEGTFSEDECDAGLVAQSSETKIRFLMKLAERVSGKLGVPVDLKPSKVVAGLEPEKTCLFLGALFKAATGESFKEGAVEKMSENHIFEEEEEKKDGRNLEACKFEAGLEGVRVQGRLMRNDAEKVSLCENENNRVAVDEEIKEDLGKGSEKSLELVVKSSLKPDSQNRKLRYTKQVKRPSDPQQVTKNEASTPPGPVPIKISRKPKVSHKHPSPDSVDIKSLQQLIQSLCSSTTSFSNLIKDLPSVLNSLSKESSLYTTQPSTLTPNPSPPNPSILAELEHEIKETQLKILQTKGRIQRNSLIINNFHLPNYSII